MDTRRPDRLDRLVHLLPSEPLVHVVADSLARRLDSEREPVEAGPLEPVEHPVAHGVHARIGPEVQVVPALDDEIADAEHVLGIEHEHLVGDLDVANAVAVHEGVDLGDHRLRAPEPVTAAVLLVPELPLAATGPPTRSVGSSAQRRLRAAQMAPAEVMFWVDADGWWP